MESLHFLTINLDVENRCNTDKPGLAVTAANLIVYTRDHITAQVAHTHR